ncbi:MAG: ribonuclease PH [Acetobacteraceae bacterium]|nr:ribonuclease PH [Acetobacteraceae bacterium]
MVSLRPSGRLPDEMRQVSLEPSYVKFAEGSCLVKYGNTHVLCTASLENQGPPFLRGSGKGWVTAEYGMLPRSTHERTRREAAAGRQSGRTQEIQRLIGRSLRAVTALELLGERQIIIDCDVLQADGGTRTASSTGGFVALHQCITFMVATRLIARHAIRDHIAAISCGIHQNIPILDLDYQEDSTAETDANFVLTASGTVVEIQGTAEGAPFSEAQFAQLFSLARKGASELVELQKVALKL